MNNSIGFKPFMSRSKKFSLLVFFMMYSVAFSQFVHPGITHKRSDLDRMKAMVEAQKDPWYSSYQEMEANSKSSYNYAILGKSSFTELGRDSKVNYSAWNSDIRAAYYNAIRWYITGDTRHAEKAIAIFKAWSNLTTVTSGGTDALSGGVGYIMIEAAEIIKSTYSGWDTADREAFENMLVYPGYSNTSAPSGNNITFYWMSYQGDPGRHGNQGLSAWRTVMAMGIFLDNEIMYDRALRYIKGKPHRADDLPYPSGIPKSTSIISSSQYAVDYNVIKGYTIPDYGFNELMTNYIWENGQCQESSRDQQHTMFGMGLLTSMAEMAWNQGEDLYGFEDDRLLLGLEYNMRYNVSSIKAYPDQTTPWEPTVASNEFVQRFDRTGRWYSKAISPDGRGDFSGVRPVFEMPVAHYLGRGLKTEEDVKWILRTRDLAIQKESYEAQGWSNDAIGWGALTARRLEHCYGDPIYGFDSNGLPKFRVNKVNNIIQAENFDYFVTEGQGKTYNDMSSSNSGGTYRNDENVDIKVCSEGGYAITAIKDGEWLTYTMEIPEDGTYNIDIRYASANANGKIKFSFGGVDVTSEVTVPFGGSNSTGLTDWKSLNVATGVSLSEGIHAMKVLVSGSDNSFELNSIKISRESANSGIFNVALSGDATQSSTASNGYAERAIDGNTDGEFSNDSVTLTEFGSPGSGELKWWQVDLQGDFTIEKIIIYNRTGFLFYVEMLNGITLEVIDFDGNVTFSDYFETYPNPIWEISTGGVLGSFVRISKTTDYGLSMAEVEVLGSYQMLSINSIQKQESINVYPNPMEDIISIADCSGEVVELYAVTGNLILRHKINSELETIDVKSLSNGIYILKINKNGAIITKKLIKK